MGFLYNSFFKNKAVLFFCPCFFNYEQIIKNELIKLGVNVDFFDERSVKSSFHRALLKISPYIFKNRTERYYNYIFNIVKDKKYDYVLFIDCEMPTDSILRQYREHFETAKFCLYLWDSINNLHDIERKFQYFDYISSFDKNDCEKNNKLKFRPLFYSDEYSDKNKFINRLNDVCFIGTIHSDRYRILSLISKQIENLGLKGYFYCFLQSKFIYYFYKLYKKEFWNTKADDFNYSSLPSKDIARIIGQSDVVIDINHPNQNGLTMRSIEALGMRKKLITTNSDIVNYDFYNENNIYIIDRDNPVIKPDFFKTEYIPIPDEIYKRYSLNQWIFDVLGIKQ